MLSFGSTSLIAGLAARRQPKESFTFTLTTKSTACLGKKQSAAVSTGPGSGDSVLSLGCWGNFLELSFFAKVSLTKIKTFRFNKNRFCIFFSFVLFVLINTFCINQFCMCVRVF